MCAGEKLAVSLGPAALALAQPLCCRSTKPPFSLWPAALAWPVCCGSTKPKISLWPAALVQALSCSMCKPSSFLTSPCQGLCLLQPQPLSSRACFAAACDACGVKATSSFWLMLRGSAPCSQGQLEGWVPWKGCCACVGLTPEVLLCRACACSTPRWDANMCRCVPTCPVTRLVVGPTPAAPGPAPLAAASAALFSGRRPCPSSSAAQHQCCTEKCTRMSHKCLCCSLLLFLQPGRRLQPSMRHGSECQFLLLCSFAPVCCMQWPGGHASIHATQGFPWQMFACKACAGPHDATESCRWQQLPSNLALSVLLGRSLACKGVAASDPTFFSLLRSADEDPSCPAAASALLARQSGTSCRGLCPREVRSRLGIRCPSPFNPTSIGVVAGMAGTSCSRQAIPAPASACQAQKAHSKGTF